jgi:hypothetical protein
MLSSIIIITPQRFVQNIKGSFKGIGSILFLKIYSLKKNCRKNYKNHLKSNNYEVCTAVARCFPNNLDVMVFENNIIFKY